MSLCCLCRNTIQETLIDYVTNDSQRTTLVKCLLKLAGVDATNCVGGSEIVCIKCEMDLRYVENFVLRISEGHQNNLFVFPKSDVEYNDAASWPVPRSRSTKSNSKSWDSQIPNESLPEKRVRRPPKRYRDEETSADNNHKHVAKNIKISTYHKNVQSSFLSAYPKMAQLRTSNGVIIGDLVEVQRRGKHSRLRILCRECRVAFTQERYFRQHLSKHLQGKERQTLLNEKEAYPLVEAINFLYLCTLCKKCFHDHSSVRRHFKTSHNEDRPYQCEMCAADFKYKTNLNYHKAKHLNQTNYHCPQCQKTFVLRYELQVHLRIHTGEKPFKCQICSMAFAHRSNLQKHRQTHRGVGNKIIEYHKRKTLSKPRISIKGHYERIYKICNNQGTECNQLLTDTLHLRNNLDMHEIPKSIDNTSLSGEGMEDTNNFKEFSAVMHTKGTETPNSSNTEETSNSLSHSQLPETSSNQTQSSASHSLLSPIISGGQFVEKSTKSDHVHDISFNTASVDVAQTFQNSNIKGTNNHTTNISPINSAIINILPKNLKIIKISKTNNSKLQDYYTKSKNTTDVAVLNSKDVTSPDDSTLSLIDKQTKLTTSSLNDTISYLPSQPDNKFIKIPVTSYANCATVRNISIDKNTTNFKMISLADLTSRNNDTCCPNSILKITQCNEIIRSSNCNNEINKELVTSNRFQNSPHKSSVLKSFVIPNFNITNIDAKDNITSKHCELLEKSYDARTTYLEMDSSKQIWSNPEKPQQKTMCDKNRDSGDSSYTETLTIVGDSSNTTVQRTPIRLKISPYSLLKSQIQIPPPRSKPLITNVEILPQLNLAHIQNPLLANEKTLQPSTPHVVKIPEEYKFQCSVCWKHFKLKSTLTKHLRTHTGEKPYKCNVCPKSYADASNYKKHKMLHIKAADALNISRPKPPPSPAFSNVTDPDPDGIEVMQTIQPFELSSGDSDDEMESYLWQDALQNSLINKEMRENIRRNLKDLNNAILPAAENISIAGRSLTRIFSPDCFQSKNFKH